MTKITETGTTRIESLQRRARDYARAALVGVQTSTDNETEFRATLCQVIHQLQEHLGLSLTSQQLKEEFLKEDYPIDHKEA